MRQLALGHPPAGQMLSDAQCRVAADVTRPIGSLLDIAKHVKRPAMLLVAALHRLSQPVCAGFLLGALTGEMFQGFRSDR